MALRQQLFFPGLLSNTPKPFSRQCLHRQAGACLGQHITVRTLKHKPKSPSTEPKKRTPVEPGAWPRRTAPSTDGGIEQRGPESQSAPEEAQQSRVEAVSSALREGAGNVESGLVAPVHMPDDPQGVLKPDHPAASILTNSSIIVQRQLEMMNVIIGFEQANKYVIMDPQGNTIGYLAEQDHGMGGTMRRQMFKTHRSFTTHVFDKNEREVLRLHRPFSWINSAISVYDCIGGTEIQHAPSDALQGTSTTSHVTRTSTQVSLLPPEAMQLIGQVCQQWTPLRRKYNLFVRRNTGEPENELHQFSHVDEPFLSWDFNLKGSDQSILGSVNRNFCGFAREILTDTGAYALRMDSASLAAGKPQQLEAGAPDTQSAQSQTNARTASSQRTDLVTTPAAAPAGMTLDQRAVMLATAVSVDFDYFSRSGRGVMGGMPIPVWLPVGGSAAGEVGAAEGAAGAAGGGARGEREMSAEEAMAVAVTGTGTMAGVEGITRGQEQGQGQVDDASPMANDPWGADGGQGLPPGQGSEDVWGDQMNWGGRGGGQDQGGSDEGSDGGEGGGSVGDFWDSFF